MNHETLLIVEDNHALREGLKEMLELEGYTVISAANGRLALEMLTSVKPPDLILSDIAMPEMDGHAFFHEVRARSEYVTIPFVFLTARGEREDVLKGIDLGAEDYLVKPISREELVTAVRARLIRSRQLRVAQLQQAYETSLTVLANAIEVRDRYTRNHVERVTAYSIEIARQMGWQGKQIEQLRFGAILHDIGKIHIPEMILAKVDPLTDQEWEEIKKHPLTGAEMIRDIPYLLPAIPVVRHHHERWDGGGYPDHLPGLRIPLPARIIAVADGFDAMTTNRPYRGARSAEQAFQEILDCAHAQYDPEVVRAFQRAWQIGRIEEIASS